jgi:AraC-like DNA-binding protein
VHDLVREVRRLIVEGLPRGSANIDAIADELNMGSKTLERRLAERGQSFSALLDATRYNAAKHYLAALVRAFKRWTGTTPMQFRDATGRSTRPTS